MSDLELDLDDFGINLNDDINDEQEKKATPAEQEPEKRTEEDASPTNDDPKGDDEQKGKATEEPSKDDTPQEGVEKPEAEPTPEPEPATPAAPITKEDLRELIKDIRNEEYDSSRQLDIVKADLESRYYPEGISRVLTDTETGKPIRTAQDVIDLAGNPDLTIEEAEQWRLQKQSELDAQVRDIESYIEKIAEQTVALDRGTARVADKYEELFKAYPELEKEALSMYTETLKIDEKTSTILEAPLDIEKFFDGYLGRYLVAFQAASQAASTPLPPAPEPVGPSKNDRLDEFGDAGDSDYDDDDDDDFEAQLNKAFKED